MHFNSTTGGMCLLCRWSDPSHDATILPYMDIECSQLTCMCTLPLLK